MICPQCRLSNSIGCDESGCPGEQAFVPVTWQRPLFQVTVDLERYEALILEIDAHFKTSPSTSPPIALKIAREAQTVRAKQKKEAGPLKIEGGAA